ncbi:hypothetical protein AB5I41_10385 [Sphingomonas sp. MMS24-JH45]
MIVAIALVVAVIVALALTFGRFARSDGWRATVTPLASIIGSGFLICGPLLAREFGGAALGAMAVLLAIAYAAGWVIRFNIVHVEPHLSAARFNDPVAWLARITQGVLALAYAVSVAYSVKLLAEFALKPIAIDAGSQPGRQRHCHRLDCADDAAGARRQSAQGRAPRAWHRLDQDRDHRRPARRARHHLGDDRCGRSATARQAVVRQHADAARPAHHGVQGFETSRYLGHAYPAELRVRTMRHAQWISSAIYLAFIALLTPFLGRAAETEGVAGILDIMELIAPALGVFVLAGAVSSQLSAAVANSIGSGGLVNEVSRHKVSVPLAFALAGALAIIVVWLTDPFEVVALSSRAFALFYALQCVLALIVSVKDGKGSAAQRVGFVAIGLVCLVATAVGAPAEG